MRPASWSSRTRLLVAAVAALLVIVSAVALGRTRNGSSPSALPAPATSAPPASPSPSPTPTPDAATLLDPEAAERIGGAALLELGRRTAQGPWAGLGDPAWPVVERPVYVARARLDDARRRLEADVTVAFRTDRARSELVLRLLPAARVLADNGSHLEVAVRRDGRPAPHQLDRDGARLLVSLDPAVTASSPTVLRVRLAYDIVDRRQLLDDGGPAGFGLLAWNPDATLLGHWLPLLTLPSDEGPVVEWGDVGAFPAAVWSVLLQTTKPVVTGGDEQPCPPEARLPTPCLWSRGIDLRDDVIVAYDDLARRSTTVGNLTIEAIGPRALEANLPEALERSSGAARSFQSRFGPLGWKQLRVVAAPLSGGAAGMEFPGLVVIGEGLYGAMESGVGAFTVAHEVGHQWFHALVSNGSLSAPVVDESLAQYLAYLYYADAYGQEAADAIAEQLFRGGYQAARQAGLSDAPPAQPLAAFQGARSYSALVYARGALAWVTAEKTAGRDAVVAFLTKVVRRWGLGFVGDRELVSFAETEAPPVGQVLRRYWLDPAPVD